MTIIEIEAVCRFYSLQPIEKTNQLVTPYSEMKVRLLGKGSVTIGNNPFNPIGNPAISHPVHPNNWKRHTDFRGSPAPS